MKLSFRNAHLDDLETLVDLLYDDILGKTRENNQRPILESYQKALTAICTDPNNDIILACDGDQILGMLQLTFIPYLTYQGRYRALIEGVRVDQRYRGQKIGKQLIEYAMQKSIEKNCVMIQLTSDKKRQDAIRFYESLGFKRSHEGFKYWF